MIVVLKWLSGKSSRGPFFRDKSGIVKFLALKGLNNNYVHLYFRKNSYSYNFTLSSSCIIEINTFPLS